jgi:hypothetical protein
MSTGIRFWGGATRSLALLCAVALSVMLALFLAWNRRSTRDTPALSANTTEAGVSQGRVQSAAVDPRLSFVTPYRNVRPEVNYVGDETCSSCHPRLFTTYRSHPMGRSLSPVATAVALERYDSASHNPFEREGFRYAVERRPQSVLHREVLLDALGRNLAETDAEVHFAIGSGERGRSYLLSRDGYLFASPITWYPQKGIWDLSPGYARRNPHFGRPVGPDCLFCHANQVEPFEQAANRYRLPLFRGTAIGCERCHGPGALHVQRHQNDEEVDAMDHTIVNPRHLDYELREAVCRQCHLQGEQRILRRGRSYFDYRPGLPLQLFFADFVKPAASQRDTKFIGTVEQMYASRCFRESQAPEKLGCISCHDPHKRPAAEKKAAVYRARCLRCHLEQSCSLPRAVRLEKEKQDSCVACHMPRTGSDINHTSITDHRIPRREAAPVAPADGWPRPGEVPLVLFPPNLAGTDARETGRDLGVALVELADRQPGPIARWLGATAQPLLQDALATAPIDSAAWEAQGSALWFQGRLEEALAAYTVGLKQAPERETTLYLAATVALRLKQRDAARMLVERAILVNPWRWQYHQMLAMLHAQNEDWHAAIGQCKETLALNPASPAARKLLVSCYLRAGDRAKAQNEFFDVLLPSSPPQQQESLRGWFERQMR